MFLILLISYSFGKDFSNSKYFWKEEPKVFNCIDSGVSSDRIKQAMKFWKEEGMPSLALVDNYNCFDGYPSEDGIYFYKASSPFDPGEHARTKVFYEKETLELRYAKIFIDEVNAENQNIVTHELGHAFGLDHSSNLDDIMFFNAKIASLKVTTTK